MRALLGLVVLLVLVIFLLSNRGSISLSFWPFGLSAALPLGAVVIAMLVIGFLAGLAAHLPKRLGAQRRAKKAERRVAELESRLGAPPAGDAPAALLTQGAPPRIPV